MFQNNHDYFHSFESVVHTAGANLTVRFSLKHARSQRLTQHAIIYPETVTVVKASSFLLYKVWTKYSLHWLQK